MPAASAATIVARTAAPPNERVPAATGATRTRAATARVVETATTSALRAVTAPTALSEATVATAPETASKAVDVALVVADETHVMAALAEVGMEALAGAVTAAVSKRRNRRPSTSRVKPRLT